jgi:hypothetical protein
MTTGREDSTLIKSDRGEIVKKLTTSRPGVVLSLDSVGRTPLDRIPVTQANAIVQNIMVRQANDRAVDVARFGSCI